MYRKLKSETHHSSVIRHGKASMRYLLAAVLVLVMLGMMLPTNVNADPAASISSDYVKVFTTQGKPVWIKLSLPSGGSNTSLTPGSSVGFRLDYCFDGTPAQKPAAGDSLQLWASGFPNGTFLLPSNMHTSGNVYRNGTITLNFANVGGYSLSEGVSGWMTVTFMASGDGAPGAYSPQITGNGSAGNIILVDHIYILEPGTDPGPSGPPVDGYSFIAKHVEHVLYSDNNGGYIPAFYQYQIPINPAFVSYELVVQDGGGATWDSGRIKEFDYFTVTDTLGPGQEFANEGFPEDKLAVWGGGPMTYGGTAPVYNITIYKHNTDGSLAFSASIDKTDPKVEMIVSADRKTFTLKIEKGARIDGRTEVFDEYCGVRLDYYAKVTDDTVMTYYNDAKIEYVKGSEVTSGASSVRVDVIKQAGADFVMKEVAKWQGVMDGETLTYWGDWDNYWASVNRGLHGANDPLIVNGGDLLVYYISYKNTGDEVKPSGYEIYDELADELELFQLRTEPGNLYAHDLNNFKFDYNESTHTVKLTSTVDIEENGGEGWVSFIVKVKDTAEPGKPIFNTAGSNTTVVKTDGYAIQLHKYDAENIQLNLEGAKFALYQFDNGEYRPYKEDGNDVVLTTGSDGKTGVINLPVGQYKLVETTTPDGYSPELNSAEVEFEILPDSAGFKGINKIAVISAPGNIPDPVDSNGVAVFKIPNDKTVDPTGNILIFKEVIGETEGGAREFKATLTNGTGGNLQFDSSGEYTGIDATECLITLDETIPVSLKNIPLSLGAITVTEKPSAGYKPTYSIGGAPGNIVYLSVNKQTVFVTVTNTVSDDPGPIVFEPTDLRLFGIKTLTDADDGDLQIDEGQFTFTLDITDDLDGGCIWDSNNSVSVSAGGNIDFGTLTFTKAGTYEIVISEDNLSAKHYGYDPDDVIATVVVTEGDGVLEKESVSYSKDGESVNGIVFNNTYAENAATQSLIGYKTLTDPLSGDVDLPITEHMFTFELTGDADNPDRWTWNAHNPVSVHADGEINFGTLTFTEAGDYIFTAGEIIPSPVPAGWDYDTEEVTVTITVGYDDDESLEVSSIIFFKGGREVNVISFANTYTNEEEKRIVEGTIVQLTATKTANREMTAGQFTFTLYESDAEGNPLAALPTKTNISAGLESQVVFDDLYFSEAGSYYYLLKETAGGVSRWRLDPVIYQIGIDVTDDGISQNLSADVSYFSWNGSGWTKVEDLTFRNTYTSSDGGSSSFREPEEQPKPVVEQKETEEPVEEDEDVESDEILDEEEQQTRQDEIVLPERRDTSPSVTPGGDNPVVQPNPTYSGSTIVPSDDDGIYVEVGVDGTPLGEWRWDDETMEWVFEEYPPLGVLPITGDNSVLLYLILLAAISLTGMTATVRFGKRTRRVYRR